MVSHTNLMLLICNINNVGPLTETLFLVASGGTGETWIFPNGCVHGTQLWRAWMHSSAIYTAFWVCLEDKFHRCIVDQCLQETYFSHALQIRWKWQHTCKIRCCVFVVTDIIQPLHSIFVFQCMHIWCPFCVRTIKTNLEACGMFKHSQPGHPPTINFISHKPEQILADSCRKYDFCLKCAMFKTWHDFSLKCTQNELTL